jgi:hypothetical protein
LGTRYVGLVAGTCLAVVGNDVICDGRNLYHPDEVEAAGLVYYGIGRCRSLSGAGK